MPARVGREARALRQDHLVVDDVHRDVQDRRLVAPPPLGPADGDVEELLALDHAGQGLGGHGAGDDVVDVGRRHAPLLALQRIDAELAGATAPRTWKMPTLATPWMSCRMFLALSASSSSWSRSGPKIFSGVVALDPGQRLQHVVADVLREVPGDARDVALQLGVHRIDELAFRPRRAWDHRPTAASRSAGITLGPVFLGPQRHEVLAAVKTLGVRAVVGPAALGDDRLDLGVAGHDGPRLLGDLHLSAPGSC